MVAAALAAAGLLAGAPAAGAQVQYPDGFEERDVVTGLDTPVGMAFLPDGRVLVTEKAGRLVLAGVGVALVPDLAGDRIDPGVVLRPVAPGATRRVGVLTPAVESPAATAFADLLVEGAAC